MSTRPTSLIFVQAPAIFARWCPTRTLRSHRRYELHLRGGCPRTADQEGPSCRYKVDFPRLHGQFHDHKRSEVFARTPHVPDVHRVWRDHSHAPCCDQDASKSFIRRVVMDARKRLAVDAEAARSAKTYVGCLQLIQDAELSAGYRSGDERLDCMIGMALCRPELLQGKSARNALQCLDDHQLRAISAWHRAQLPE